ncbi:MAG TPA: EpsI family protein [Terriglobia bacterium]|nr:EpsI family protein [Terriglobia bacterium]
MREQTLSWPRFIPVLVLLGISAAFLRAHAQPERQMPRQPLDSFPASVGAWTEAEQVPITQEVRDLMPGGDLMERIYQRPDGAYLDLYIAYFPSQRTGDLIHSPKHCLPGAGWVPEESDVIQIQAPDGEHVPVNRYVIAKGQDRQVALYWYLAHGRTETSEYLAKFYLVADAIRLNRTDGSLVRVITPLGDGEAIASGQARAADFAGQILPLLGSYIPR